MEFTSIPLLALALIGSLMSARTATSQTVQTAPQWQEVELAWHRAGLARLFEGSRYPGIVAKIFVLYLPEGGTVAVLSRDVPRSYRVFDPRTGEVLSEGRLAAAQPAQAISGPGSDPRVLVFCSK